MGAQGNPHALRGKNSGAQVDLLDCSSGGIVQHAAKALRVDVRWPVQYERCDIF